MVQAHLEGRLALLDEGPRLAHLGLLLGGPQGHPRAGAPRRRVHLGRQAGRLRERHPVLPEQDRGLGDVREHEVLCAAGADQPGGNVRGHRDRLRLRGVLVRLPDGARGFHRG